jgi:hypothetical protein
MPRNGVYRPSEAALDSRPTKCGHCGREGQEHFWFSWDAWGETWTCICCGWVLDVIGTLPLITTHPVGGRKVKEPTLMGATL